MDTVQQVTRPESDKSENRDVTGRELLSALGYGVVLALSLGLLTGFVLRRFIPALSDNDWLATVIATEVYAGLIVGHLLVFGGFKGLRARFGLGPVPWRHVWFAFWVWLGVWAAALGAYLVLSPVWSVMGSMGEAVLKVGSLFGRLDGAGPALFTLAVLQPILLTPLFEELLYRGSLFGWLRSKLAATVTIVLTSLPFAMLHPLILVWPLTFLFGLGAGWVRERTGSVTPFLIMHALNSVTMITMAYFIAGWRV